MGVSEKLRYARERAGLTGAQVRERTGVGESSLSEFENGKREPSLSQLRSLAKAYQRSVSFLLDDAPIPEETVLWRERPTTMAEDTEARFLRLCEQYHNLEAWCDEREPVRLPGPEGREEPFSYDDAEELAKRVRHDLELGNRPALSLLTVLEEVCGVKVFHLDFEPTGTAACAKSPSFGSAILLNAGSVRWRRNFDLAHELFHLLTWGIFRSGGGASAEASAEEEKLATCFSRNLLMPPEAFRTEITRRLRGGRASFDDLFEVARQFDVSIESLLWHFHFLYRTPGESAQTQDDIERAKACRPLLDKRPTDKPPVWPARYHDLAVKALRRGEMSVGRFAEYLDISRRRAMEYVEQEVPPDGEIQVSPA